MSSLAPLARPTLPDAPRRGRGRPKAEAVIALNGHITDVARDVFMTVGFGSATMDAIAQRARVSKETLYSRFPNKASLFEAVIKAQLEAWGKRAIKHNPVVITTSLAEAIRHHVEVQVRVSLSPEFMDFQRLILAEAMTFPELAKSMFSNSYEGRIVAVANNIRKFAEEDGVPAKDPDSAAEILRSMVAGWLAAIMSEGRRLSEEEIERFINRVTEIFLASRPAW